MSSVFAQPVRAALNQTLPLKKQVYDQLHERIIGFDLEPYQRLSEKLIAEELNVSRTPVREALARLADLHLVDIFPQRGTLVAPVRLMDVEQSQLMREAIELALLRRVMETPDRVKLVEKMRNEIKLQTAFVQVKDTGRFYESDEHFHGMIARHARMAPILQEVERAKIHMDRVRRLMIEGVENLEAVIAQHGAIVDAIESGDVEGGQHVLLQHLRRVFAYLDDTIAKYPHYFELEDRPHVMVGREKEQ